MEKFVNELTNQLEGLNQQIDDVKKKIQDYNIRGAAIEKTDEKKREEKTDITKKIEMEVKASIQSLV
eukprot:CAMPEP_0114599738 /NCGR_PEP_ID=MMETSP0125-20121206/22264_1 /TAXON_ID=485358 ORGANISM="Aristerostoma sp., Strain ATCC 50986" /NCGR_SAMPLE_ID=MMETSP0125 /ASSEMBLY_ACC=CAM_ASM_000245 /LENGTH=66 /DNA_ID=CAMNT_0001807081 /DNA_START=735 /DNA_END=935 /DNA_ORIENTATION=-